MLVEKPKFEVSTRVYALLVVFLIGLIAFWGFRIYEISRSATGNYPREISVEGLGKAYAIPDIAVINLGVTTDAKTSDAAVKENTAKMNKVMEAVKSFNFDKKDVQTLNYSLSPNYKWSEEKGQSVQDGYTLNQQISIKVRDFTKVGDVIAAVTKAGANMIGNLSFEVDDMDKVRDEARSQAIAKAKAKAEKMADEAGLDLGKVVSIYEYDTVNPYYNYGKGGYAPEMAMADSSAGMIGGGSSPIIEPGQQEFQLTVTLNFRID